MAIYAKLDWYSAVLYNRSMSYILGKLGVHYELYDQLMASAYEQSRGFKSAMVFSANNITLEMSFDDFLSTEYDKLFDTSFSKIRLDISGKGLDYLRSVMNIDNALTDDSFWGENLVDYHVTRADFAFDFVNYKGEFVDNLMNWIKDAERSGDLHSVGRLRTGVRSGCKYSYRCGDQKTVYFGCSGSDKLVRIYDKLLEYSKNGVVVKELPQAFADEGEINSWFRIEFQNRRKVADMNLFGCNGNLERVLRHLFDSYLIRDKNNEPLPFMVDLYDWESLPPIIQNLQFAITKSVLDKSHDYVLGQAFRSVFMLMLRYGVDVFVHMINRRATQLYLGTGTASIYGNLALRKSLAQMLEEESLSIDDLKGLTKEGNNFFVNRKS